MACTPQELVTAASKFQGIPTGMQTNIATAVACQLAGIEADPQALVEAAKCIECGKTEPILLAIAAVCNLTPGATTTITLPTDPDAKDFFCAILNKCFQDGSCSQVTNCSGQTTITVATSCLEGCAIDQTLSDSLDDLVISLKSEGLWALMDIIYPFVGGTASTNSINLKDPNSFVISWHGGVTFSTGGVKGDAATGYGDTGYNPSVSGVNFTLNSAAMGFYVSQPASTGTYLGGAFSVLAIGVSIQNSLAVGWTGDVNAPPSIGSASTPVALPLTGNYAINRTAANLTTLTIPNGTTGTSADAATGLTAFSLYVLGLNFSSTPIGLTDATLTFAWAGGLSLVQQASLSTIITTFETALGRA